jgi:hypothetical protein
MSDEFKDIDEKEIDSLVEEDSAADNFRKLLQRNQELANEVLELKGSDSPDEVRVKARNFALSHLQDALNTIAEIMLSGDKDSTRLAASRTIWTIAASTSTKDDADPLTELFNKLGRS